MPVPVEARMRQAKRSAGYEWSKRYEQCAAWLMIVANDKSHYAKKDYLFINNTTIPDILSELALRLRDLEDVHNTPPDVLLYPGYVARADLQGRIYHEFKRGKKVVHLYGDAGTGKSTIAEAIAKTLADEDGQIVRIDARTSDSISDDISDYLLSIDISPPETTDGMMRRFSQELRKTKGKKVFILDNVDDERTLDLLLHSRHRERIFTRVLITSQIAAEKDPATGVVSVGNLSPEEGAAMARHRLPILSEEDASRLAKAVDFRPLVLEHALSVLKTYKGEVKVDELIEAIDRDVVQLIDALPGNRKLTAIYRQLLKTMESEEQYFGALRVLELMAAMGEYVPVNTVSRALQWNSSELGDEALGTNLIERLTTDTALEALRQLSLIASRRHADGREVVIMHGLTNTIFAGLCKTRKRAELLVGMVTAAYNYLIEIDWAAEDKFGLRCEAIHLFVPLIQMTEELRNMKDIEPPPRRLAYVVAALLRFSQEWPKSDVSLLRLAVVLLVDLNAEDADSREFRSLYIAVLAAGGTFACEDLRTAIKDRRISERTLEWMVLMTPFLDQLAGDEMYSVAAAPPFDDHQPAQLSGVGLSPSIWKIKVRLLDAIRLGAQCQWSDADEALDECFRMADPSHPTGDELRVDIVRQGLKNSIRSPGSPNLRSWVEKSFLALSRESNVSTIQRMRLSSTLGCTIFQQGMKYFSVDKQKPILEVGLRLLKSSEVYYGESGREHLLAVSSRESAGVVAFASPCGAQGLLEQGHECGQLHLWGSSLNCLQYRIGHAKNLVPHYDIHNDNCSLEHDQDMLPSVISLIGSLRDSVNSPEVSDYLYHTGDALRVAYVLAKKIDSSKSVVDELHNRAEGCLERISRPDLWEIAKGVADEQIPYEFLFLS